MISLKKILFTLFISLVLPAALTAQTFTAWLKAGDESFRKSNYGESIEYYSKANEFETGDLSVTMKLAESLRLYKDYEKASAWYGKVVIADKVNNYPMALFRYAEMRKYLGNYEDAARLFERYTTTFPNDTSYTGIKSRKETDYCKKAILISQTKVNVEVTNAGAPVNSNYSEFGASMMGDTTLYFSSLKYLFEPSKKEDPYYVSRILKAAPKSGRNMQPLPLGISINESSTHNCNTAFSPDYRFMIFSRCSQKEDFTLDCQLYISRLEKDKWSKPVIIIGDVNLDGYTSTQPAIEARGADGYTLYFISDRPGGKGKLDLWKSDMDAAGIFSASVNLGEPINSFDDEMTPFFDTPKRTLYFSSYGHAGLGGMDIFKSERINSIYAEPVNLGPGYNSSVDDVYYTLNRDGINGTLSSNRYGSLYLSSRYCCYDVYYYKMLPADTVQPPADTVIVAVVPSQPNSIVAEDKKVLSTTAYYDQFIPLELYFENDQPDKKSIATKSKRDYESLYKEYISSIDEYKTNYAGKLSGDTKVNAEQDVDDFFNLKVIASRNKLGSFCSKLEKALILGIDIELEIRGRASPLAESKYNISLSSRRISSLINYMRIYNNGVLASFIDDKSLIITEVPAGETLSQKGISDNLNDKKNSVYNPAAAVERRIELINIRLSSPEDVK